MKYLKMMDYVKEEVRKNVNRENLEISMILEQLSRKENIISYTYKKPYLMVKVGEKDYYRINLKEVNKC